MPESTKPATIYLDADLHRALRVKAAATRRSVSEPVTEAVRRFLSEDQEDLRAFEERAAEPSISYAALLKAIEAPTPGGAAQTPHHTDA